MACRLRVVLDRVTTADGTRAVYHAGSALWVVDLDDVIVGGGERAHAGALLPILELLVD